MHRAWWDAYGSTAHSSTSSAVDADAPAGAELDPAAVRGIVPLMHRHEVEPEDAATATHMRHGHPTTRAVHPTAKAIFFGASYHADYATILAEPSDLEAVAEAVADALLAGPDLAHGETDWDVVDLRRLRHDDPALPALQRAFERRSVRGGWHVFREQEDVCPVLTLPDDGDWETYLSSLDKKDRHEIRRKIRRAEAAGPNTFRLVDPTPEAVEAFIDLHQSKWGDEGLFPATAGGDRSRRFIHRLAELELETGADRQLQLGRFEVDGRVVMTDRRLRRWARVPVLQRRRQPRCTRAVARRDRHGRLPARPPGRRSAALRLPARRRALQVRMGRRRRTDLPPPRGAFRVTMSPDCHVIDR